MCGIAGIISSNESGDVKEHLRKMTSVLRHRGPDDEGFTFFKAGNAFCEGGEDTPPAVRESRYPFSPKISQPEITAEGGMGHRRLSILDPSPAGHQPMCDANRRYWLVFNGEIYNYPEIRNELLLKGHTFISDGDTEVILQAYIAWGKECVLKFNGMWAFAIYDSQQKTLFCSRDRFGVKPFYFYQNKDFFVFASELKAIVSLPFVKKEVNEAAVFDYIVLGQTELEPEGFFKNIFELEPAHNLFLANGNIHKEKYYQLPVNLAEEKFNTQKKSEYTEQVSSLIHDAVKLRLRSDVPVGACLSGGIDSSALVCTANKIRKSAEPFHVFTSVFPGSTIDETSWAAKVVAQTGTTWHTVETSPEELLSEYEQLIYSQDIPFFGSSTLSQSNVMQLIKKTGIKVTLDGQGADELFSGYPQHFYVSAFEDLKNLNSANLKYLYRAEENSNQYFAKFLFKKAVSNLPAAIGYRILKSSKYDFQLLKNDFWNTYQHRYEAFRQKYPSNLNKFLSTEFNGAPLKYLMRTADRNSMRHSVESRVPFADDHRLAELVFSIPSTYKIHQGESKYLLREGMKGIIPEAIRLRQDKKGFATPELQWFKSNRNELRSLVTENLEPFVDVKQLHKNWDTIFDKHLAGNTLGISRFIILSLWRNKFGI